MPLGSSAGRSARHPTASDGRRTAQITRRRAGTPPPQLDPPDPVQDVLRTISWLLPAAGACILAVLVGAGAVSAWWVGLVVVLSAGSALAWKRRDARPSETTAGHPREYFG